jgi:hypothetical protein
MTMSVAPPTKGPGPLWVRCPSYWCDHCGSPGAACPAWAPASPAVPSLARPFPRRRYGGPHCTALRAAPTLHWGPRLHCGGLLHCTAQVRWAPLAQHTPCYLCRSHAPALHGGPVGSCGLARPTGGQPAVCLLLQFWRRQHWRQQGRWGRRPQGLATLPAPWDLPACPAHRPQSPPASRRAKTPRPVASPRARRRQTWRPTAAGPSPPPPPPRPCPSAATHRSAPPPRHATARGAPGMPPCPHASRITLAPHASHLSPRE